MARQLIVLALILVALGGLVLADEELIITTAATPEAPSGATASAATPEGAEIPSITSVDLSSIATIPSNTPPSPTMAAGESSADEAATPVSAPPKEEKKSENDAATLKVSAAAGVAAVAGLLFF